MKKTADNTANEAGLNKAYFYLTLAAMVVLAIVTILALVILWTDKQSDDETQNSIVMEQPTQDSVHAVFLTNGQVYFGEIKDTSVNTIVLENIYYLQSDKRAQAADLNKQSDVKLIKLGKELHGPEDKMLINRDNVLFVERLRDDSKVVKAIDEYAIK